MSTVVPRYMWLFPKLEDNKVTGSPDIEVNGPVRAVDGGVHLDGQGSFLKVGNFDSKCLHDPSKCPNGLSLSCKLKFNRVRFSDNQAISSAFVKTIIGSSFSDYFSYYNIKLEQKHKLRRSYVLENC